MSWRHDTDSKNGSHKGYTGNRDDRFKPSYGWSISPNGRKHDITGYSEVHNAKSYSSETKQVVEVRRPGGGGGGGGILDYSPRSHDKSKRGNQHQILSLWQAMVPELHNMSVEDSIKPVHLMAHTNGNSKHNSPRNSHNTGSPTEYKHNISPNNPHVGSNFHDHSSLYGNSSDDDDEDTPKPFHSMAHSGGNSKHNNLRNSHNTGSPIGYKHNIPPHNPHVGSKSHDYGSMYGNSSDDDEDDEDSPKPFHLVAQANSNSKLNNPHNSYNISSPTGYKHNVPPKNPHVGSKPHDRSYMHGKSRDDDDDDDDEYTSDSDDESVFSWQSRKHGSKVSDYPKLHEKPNGHNHPQVKPSVPITTYYESRPFVVGPPRINTNATPDHFHKKSPKHLAAAPVGGQYNGSSKRKGKKPQGIIDSSEAQRLYGGVQVPTTVYQKEQNNEIIDCKEAAKKYHGVFVPTNIVRGK